MIQFQLKYFTTPYTLMETFVRLIHKGSQKLLRQTDLSNKHTYFSNFTWWKSALYILFVCKNQQWSSR